MYKANDGEGGDETTDDGAKSLDYARGRKYKHYSSHVNFSFCLFLQTTTVAASWGPPETKPCICACSWVPN